MRKKVNIVSQFYSPKNHSIQAFMAKWCDNLNANREAFHRDYPWTATGQLSSEMPNFQEVKRESFDELQSRFRGNRTRLKPEVQVVVLDSYDNLISLYGNP
jgi:hypothetical protein